MRTTTKNTPQKSTNGNGTATPPGAPTGWTPITVQLSVENVKQACEFYQKLGFSVEQSVSNSQGDLFWATLRLGGSRVFVTESFGGPLGGPGGRDGPTGGPSGPSGPMIYCYVPNVESVLRSLNRLGCTPEGPVSETFWGDRTVSVADPYGYRWTFATHLRDVSPQEIAEAAINH